MMLVAPAISTDGPSATRRSRKRLSACASAVTHAASWSWTCWASSSPLRSTPKRSCRNVGRRVEDAREPQREAPEQAGQLLDRRRHERHEAGRLGHDLREEHRAEHEEVEQQQVDEHDGQAAADAEALEQVDQRVEDVGDEEADRADLQGEHVAVLLRDEDDQHEHRGHHVDDAAHPHALPQQLDRGHLVRGERLAAPAVGGVARGEGQRRRRAAGRRRRATGRSWCEQRGRRQADLVRVRPAPK
jgi:hypothetical protein